MNCCLCEMKLILLVNILNWILCHELFVSVARRNTWAINIWILCLVLWRWMLSVGGGLFIFQWQRPWGQYTGVTLSIIHAWWQYIGVTLHAEAIHRTWHIDFNNCDIIFAIHITWPIRSFRYAQLSLSFLCLGICGIYELIVGYPC